MSIRRVIFTSGQNLKRPFLWQYLTFFNNFLFTSNISSGSLLYSKTRNLKKIADLKVYGNLKVIPQMTSKFGKNKKVAHEE